MKKFDKIKAEFIELLRDKSPCQPEYRRVLESTKEEQLLQVIADNIGWCIEKKVFGQSFLDQFDAKILIASGLAQGGKENSGIANSGDRNSGSWNSGDRNSGSWNSGYRNSGDRNSGDRNSGSWNSGSWNSGYRNSGDRNSGDRNSGDSNSGYRNSGDRNSGSWNSGDRNSGDSNSGYRNSGAFCTDPNPCVWLFDQPTNIKVRDWEQHEACRIMNDLNPNIWVWSDEMTSEEKTKFPTHETTGGYLKSIPYKEAWNNLWGNLTDAKRKVFTSLPNFNADKFFEITGIRV